MAMIEERRAHRSDVPEVALELLLEACRAKGDFDLVVVADSGGLLVASSTSAGVDAIEVAAVLPFPERAEEIEGLTVLPFRAVGETLLLGVVGRAVAMAPLENAMIGTHRVLAA